MDNTAILLIEFQKTWTEKGIFHKIIRKEYTSGNVLSNTKEVLSVARNQGLKIIQAPLILDKTDKERYKKTPLPARLLKRFTKGTWKADFTDGIYENTDIVVQGRFGFDACKGSNLEQLLKENGIKNVYVCGFTTDHCVKETINSLTDKGFKCILVSDCTATRNHKLQEKIEKELEIISGKQLIKEIGRNTG
ncbi:MAG: cysteine hydrolase [Chlorobi bacterium]|nr:cysteine hydrolase [Chlorobiota bacterium]